MADDNKVSEFLNPKSMLTPGACGAVIMIITNAFGASFGLQGIGRTLLGLGLSLLFGTVVLAAKTKSLWQKGVLYVLNSLVIFSMATGTNSAGSAVASPKTPASPPPVAPPQTNIVATVTHTNLAHVRVAITNYTTNVVTKHPTQMNKVKPQFFERWH